MTSIQLEVDLIINGNKINRRAVRLMERIGDLGLFVKAAREVNIHPRLAKELMEKTSKNIGGEIVSVKLGGKDGGSTSLTRVGDAIVSCVKAIERDTYVAARTELDTLLSELGRAP